MHTQKRPYTTEQEQAIKMMVASATDAELADGAWWLTQYESITGDRRDASSLAWRVRALTLNTPMEQRGKIARRTLDTTRYNAKRDESRSVRATVAMPRTPAQFRNLSEDGGTMDVDGPRGGVLRVMAPWKVAEVVGIGHQKKFSAQLAKIAHATKVRRVYCVNPTGNRPILAWSVADVDRIVRARSKPKANPSPSSPPAIAAAAPAPPPAASKTPEKNTRQLEIPSATSAAPRLPLNGHTNAARLLIVDMMSKGQITAAQAVAMLAETA